MELRHEISADKAIEAFRVAPSVLVAHIGGATLRGAQEVAREAKLILAENGSMARSTLANSIRVLTVGPMHHRVEAGTTYARMVEEGTGPAAGRKAYMPNPVRLRDYVKQRAAIRFTGRRGSARRRSQQDELRDRAFALAMHIKKYGTKPHPFMAPAAERKKSRVFALVQEAVNAGIAEILGPQ